MQFKILRYDEPSHLFLVEKWSRWELALQGLITIKKRPRWLTSYTLHEQTIFFEIS